MKERKIKMAKYRKLGRTSSQRKALIRNQVTALYTMARLLQQRLRLRKSEGCRGTYRYGCKGEG